MPSVLWQMFERCVDLVSDQNRLLNTTSVFFPTVNLLQLPLNNRLSSAIRSTVFPRVGRATDYIGRSS